MKKKAAALEQLVRLARSAPPGAAPAPDDSLPPGLATRIAATWAAAEPVRAAAWLWERLSFAGLAAALLICAGSFLFRPAASGSGHDPGPAENFSLPDLLNASISPDDSGL